MTNSHLTNMMRSSAIRAARDAEMVAMLECRTALGLPTGMLVHWINSHRNGRFTYAMQQHFEQMRRDTYFAADEET